MARRLLTALVALALTATAASATGIDYYWNDCFPAGVVNRDFACNTNTGIQTSVASYQPPAGLTLMNGNALVVDLQSASSPLPDWWHFKNAGTCRQASLTVSFDFTAGPFTCTDFWAGGASGGIGAYTVGFEGTAARARLTIAIAVPSAQAGPVDPGTVYYSCKINFNNAKTVGTGACAGCTDPVCLVLNEIQLTQPSGTAGGSPRIVNALNGNFVTWQGGIVGGPGCPAIVPVRSTTWGKVKSLYR